MSSQDGVSCIWLLWRDVFCLYGGRIPRGPRVWVLSGFDLVVEGLGKNNDFLESYFLNL